MKYLKNFDTINEYNTYINSSNAYRPNVSLVNDENTININYNPNFFCKLYLNNETSVNLEGREELTSEMISDYKVTCVRAEIGTLCTSIGNYAFNNCTSLTSVTIPNSVTSIGSSIFMGCSGLTSVTIPNSVTSIGNKAFEGCTSLTSVTIPNSVRSIEMHAFQDCSSLTSVIIPDSVRRICIYAFENCSSLTSVTIPNSVTDIADGAFQDCTSLTSVTIPDSVTSIGDYTFDKCSKLTTITVKATTPPVLGFSSIPDNVTTIYVPSDSVNAYKSASGWNNYASKIQAIQE